MKGGERTWCILWVHGRVYPESRWHQRFGGLMIVIASIAFIYYSRPVRAVCSPWLVAKARQVSKEFLALMARHVSKELVALKARPSFKRVRSLATKVRRARHISKGAKGKGEAFQPRCAQELARDAWSPPGSRGCSPEGGRAPWSNWSSLSRLSPSVRRVELAKALPTSVHQRGRVDG